MNNNDIDYGLNSTGKYLNRIAEYFKAMNKKLWARNGESDGLHNQVLHIPNADKYNILTIEYALDYELGTLTRKNDSYGFAGSANMQFDSFMISQNVELTPIGNIEDNNYKLTCKYTRIDSSKTETGQTQYGIKAIFGVVPTPEKFGLGGVILQLRNLFSPKGKAVGIC